MAAVWTSENAQEELLNSATHGLGVVLAVPGAISLVWLASHARPEVEFACGLYGLALIAVYLCSTLSHAVREPVWRSKMRAWDQGVIYLMIVGTYTPFAWGFLNGSLRWTTLIAMWTIAAIGFYSKVFARHRIDSMTALWYVLLGWGPACLLFNYVPMDCLIWMAIGGLIYTCGIPFLQYDHKSRLFHSVWHLSVIAASICHYFAIVHFVVYEKIETF